MFLRCIFGPRAIWFGTTGLRALILMKSHRGIGFRALHRNANAQGTRAKEISSRGVAVSIKLQLDVTSSVGGDDRCHRRSCGHLGSAEFRAADTNYSVITPGDYYNFSLIQLGRTRGSSVSEISSPPAQTGTFG